MSVFWLVIGMLHLRTGLRFRGAAGRARFGRLSDRRARAVHEGFSSKVMPYTSAFGLSMCVLGLCFGILGRVPTSVTLWGAAALILASSLALQQRTRGDVFAAFAERDLEPVQRRERSAKRDRRQKQFGVVAVLANIVAEVARYLDAREEQPVFMVVAAVAVLVAFGALGALLWSTAWVFGDEKQG